MTSVIVALEPSASSAATMLESRYDLMNSRVTQIVKIDGKVTLKPFGSHSGMCIQSTPANMSVKANEKQNAHEI